MCPWGETTIPVPNDSAPRYPPAPNSLTSFSLAAVATLTYGSLARTAGTARRRRARGVYRSVVMGVVFGKPRAVRPWALMGFLLQLDYLGVEHPVPLVPVP